MYPAISAGNRTCELQVFYDAPSDEMVREDALDVFGSTVLVPNTLGINNRNWARDTGPKAFYFAALDASLLGKTELFESRFKVIPGCSGGFAAATRLFRGSNTHEDMSARLLKTEGFGHGSQGFQRHRKGRDWRRKGAAGVSCNKGAL